MSAFKAVTPPPSRCVFAARHLPRFAGEEEAATIFSSPVQRGRWREAQPRDGGGVPA